MGELSIDEDLLSRIEHRLELRTPNVQAIESVAKMVSQHFDVDSAEHPYECIVDSATGVGKTYVMGGLIEYFAGRDTPARNFLLLAPGRTIRNKSVQNFTPGHRRSLTGRMESRPYLVTSDNFDSAATRVAMQDTAVTKLYIFTVQALTSKDGEGRATHEFVEGLGGSFYKWLSELNDLVILADEQHCYRGKAFARTIKELKPEVVVGLTATPDKADTDTIVYRYPLARAIEDKFVKTPSIVARTDDRVDDETKLLDGVTLLRYKERLAQDYCAQHNLPTVNPVMLVIASDVSEAERYRDVLDSAGFDGGTWVDRTLLVHSKLTGEAKEDALAALDAVEDPESPVRIIISVGMLKEGWDVKNVYVIASMRASVSDVLTEQTLGRGLRLPFGEYTGNEFLDTVEVLAHERYKQLLERREALNEKFIDYSVVIETRQTKNGPVARPKIVEESGHVIHIQDPQDQKTDDPGNARPGEERDEIEDSTGFGGIRELDHYLVLVEREADQIVTEARSHDPLPEREPILVPYVEKVPSAATVSLNQIDADEAFTRLGRALGSDTEHELKRMLLQAEAGRIRQVRGKGVAAGQTLDIPLDASRSLLIDRVMAVKSVRPTAAERRAAERLVDLVVSAMGTQAGVHLSAFFDRASRRLADLVASEMSKASDAHVSFTDQVKVVPLDKTRTFTKRHEADHTEPFETRCAYNGWKTGLYAYSTFDTSTEYEAAAAIDAGPHVVVWARLHRNDLPITWTMDGRVYNPDFVVVEDEPQETGETKRVCWIVETKQQRMLGSDEVNGKQRAARTWARTVNVSDLVTGEWRYLLLLENDVKDADGNWEQMKRFGQ